jgi:hypothetical protein
LSFSSSCPKKRKGKHPTTDLNIAQDPFTTQERQWVRQLLDQRLAPTISRIYGIPPLSIRADDLFVVRYTENNRRSLEKHIDGADISVNILLSDDFEGGGTRFWNRLTRRPFDHVHPQRIGNVLTHSALLQHEGYPIESGERYILVAFLSVDIFTTTVPTRYTGISCFATIFSYNWIFRRMTDYYSDSKEYIDENLPPTFQNWLRQFFSIIGNWGDRVEHKVEVLVDEKDAISFIRSLDENFHNNNNNTINHNNSNNNNKARWWSNDNNETITSDNSNNVPKLVNAHSEL